MHTRFLRFRRIVAAAVATLLASAGVVLALAQPASASLGESAMTLTMSHSG